MRPICLELIFDERKCPKSRPFVQCHGRGLKGSFLEFCHTVHHMLKSRYKMHYFFVCALCKLCLECSQAPSNCVQSARVLINTAWSTQLLAKLAALVLLTIYLKDNSMRNYWSPHVEVTITAKDKTLIFSVLWSSS